MTTELMLGVSREVSLAGDTAPRHLPASATGGPLHG
jgi:hypothetical protein